MKRKTKFADGGEVGSGIGNEPVGANLRRAMRRIFGSPEGPPAPAPRSTGGQRPQEDRARMAEEAAAQFDAEERALMERRRNRGSAITNRPVGERLAGGRAAPAPAPAQTAAPESPIRSAGIGEGGTPQPRSTMQRPRPRPTAREATSADDLNAIVLKLQRGEPPATETERRLADRMGIAYRKGGLVKPKGHGPKEEAMEMKGGRYRGGAKEERAEMKAKGGIIKSKAKSPANLKGKTLMKKGGEASLASGLRGGVVKKPGTDSFNFQAKKMATGGVVEKGGNKYGFTNAKTKMLRRGGMAKGCK